MLIERTSLRGQRLNKWIPYKPDTQPEGRCRIVRSPGHDTMPYFPVCWLAKKEDDGDGGLYRASILALLKPWRTITDIKEGTHTFRMAFEF